jgi:CBS domain-containing protein
MFVQDCMTRNVVTVSPDTSVLAARRMLVLHGIRHLPVVADGEVVGIVSDRDIRINDRQLVASLGALQSDLVTGRYRRVASVMTAPALVVRPKMKLHLAALFMVSRRIGGLPVVEDGKLVGIITLTDCVRALALENHKLHTQAGTPRNVARRTSMPAAGDPRPGRPQPDRVAVVVEPDPLRRLQARNGLVQAGYTTVTCPGPAGGANCPARREPGASSRCGRVPADAQLVLLPSDENALPLAEAYARWLPDAVIRMTAA